MATNKSTKSRTSKPAQGEVVQQEDIVQAIVIADSFNIRFSPVTQTKPKALLPLVNCPMIEYALESLLASGVQETFVYCVSHADQIRNYLKDSKWMQATSPMSVQVLSSKDSRSLGDALRDIDGKCLIRNDFILFSSDVISNAHLLPILEKHKERKKTDKGLIMTHIFRHSFPGNRTRTSEDEYVLALNPSTGRILHYQATHNLAKLRFPLEIFQDNTEVELHFDLVNTHISICSPHVLPLFSDNFDYQTHGDFVRGILINEELLGNTIYCHQLEGSYAAEVSNIHMYDAISKDIIHRWVYPLVPDMMRSCGSRRHMYLRHNVYLQPNVTLAKGSVLEMDVVVGKDTSIGEDTHISRSVIGGSCNIGNSVTITEAYIWDNVVIKDGCAINTSLIAEGVVLNENVELGKGCVLGPGVILAPGTKVPSHTRLVAHLSNTDDNSESSDEEDEVAIPFGPGCTAYLYRNRNDDESDEDSVYEEHWGTDREQEDEFEGDDDLDGEEEEVDSDDDGEDIEEQHDALPDDARLFYTEVLDSLKRGFDEGIACENIILEINSSKYAYNVTMKEVNTLLIKAILTLPISNQVGDLSNAAYFPALKSVLQYSIPLLQNYIRNSDSQLECIYALEDHAVSHPAFLRCISNVLAILYHGDILSEEILLDWFKNPPRDPCTIESVRKAVERFIDWLVHAEEESESD